MLKSPSRRGFLGALGGFAAGMALDPERVLWRAGAKVISIPKPRSPFVLLEHYGQSIFPLYSFNGNLTPYAVAYPEDAFNRTTGSFDVSRVIRMDMDALCPLAAAGAGYVYPREMAHRSDGRPIKSRPFSQREGNAFQRAQFYA